MLTKIITALVLLQPQTQPAPSAIAPPSAPAPAAIASPLKVTLKDVNPKYKPLLVKRAKQCFRLPGGAICDASQYYEFQDLIDKYVRLEDTGYWNSNGYVKQWVKTGTKWGVAENDQTNAWGLEIGEAYVPSGDRLDRVQEIYAAVFRNGSSLNRSMLVCQASATNPKEEFLFIDDLDRDAFATNTMNRHRTQIDGSRPGNVQIVNVRPLGQQGRAQLSVKVPETIKITGDWLPGKFVLVKESTDPKAKADAAIYEYHAVKSDVTADDLAQAVADKSLRLFQWTSKRVGDDYRWSLEEPDLFPKKATPKAKP